MRRVPKSGNPNVATVRILWIKSRCPRGHVISVLLAMPKLKLLDTRQTSEEIVAMSWSPKMDLLALGSSKGHVNLHRLSWQRVWQIPLNFKEKTVIPELMTWHPEGLFLVVTGGEITFVIDVEGGKVVHNHEISFRITSAHWTTSEYQHSLNEALSSHFRQQQIQRFENNLSILFLGTANGYVYAYTGGFLLGLCIKVAEDTFSTRIVQIESTLNLQSFYFLSEETVQETSSSGNENKTKVNILFSHLKNHRLSKMAHIIRPLGLRYILFLKSWATVQGELANLSESWVKLVDLHTTYMTLGGTKDLETVKVDYLELALSGVSCAEMEIFIGSVGREKEAKKNINVINSASGAIIEHVRTIKCSITNMFTELNEIGGFLQQVSEYEGASDMLIELRKAVAYLFLAILNLQSLVHNFVEAFLNFVNLIVNTIHSFNVQDIPDFIESECDIEKVLEFLQAKIDKDIFVYLFDNIQLGYRNEGGRGEESKNDFCSKDTDVTISSNVFSNIMNPEGGQNNYQDFATVIKQALKKSSFSTKHGHPLLLDYTQAQVKDMIFNIVPNINGLTKNLLCVPVLCSVPFESDTIPLIELPDGNRPSNGIGHGAQLLLNEPISRCYVSVKANTKSLLLFEIDPSEIQSPKVRSAMLCFSKPVKCFDLFNSTHLTVTCKDSYTEKEKLKAKAGICQIPYVQILSRGKILGELSSSTNSSVMSMEEDSQDDEATIPLPTYVKVPPTTPTSTSPSRNSMDCFLSVDGFNPHSISVSGARKVGCLLAEDKRTLVMFEVEMTDQTGESTLDNVSIENENEGSDDTTDETE